ncbi:Arylsulfatase [Tolypocladium capitatum]|uniref:Arylsulfatase n=1 Tax=Tolypocladium capitatum TaxID=45235 RepID=A0A2K3QQZ6_9HYPO|nr:Arylsulfatase [Tolypocladium capitatum]
MVPLSRLFFVAAIFLLAAGGYAKDRCKAKRPNIILILTDDQDLHLGSLDYMPSVQRELISEGTSFSNHFTTVSQGCPSRASLLRGQHAHNTNLTHVQAPGGNYAKWKASGQDEDYLPFWLNKAGYHTECKPPPNHLEPWAYDYNTPVFSKNGLAPVLYSGYHQTDVIRAKVYAAAFLHARTLAGRELIMRNSLSRLNYLTQKEQDRPFFLTIAPAAPHVELSGFPKPQERHKDSFLEAEAPKPVNFNPLDYFARQKPSWLKRLQQLKDSAIDLLEVHFHLRIQALLGVDEIVHDVVKLLEGKYVMHNTYIVYTSDNGYHLGQHRVPAGKSLPYLKDTNLPFIVRGPGVPTGKKSRLPGTHLDLAPTFLDIACVDPQSFPVYLDGRSLLDNWHNPKRTANGSESASRDIINVEFWGSSVFEIIGHSGRSNNSYKTIRIVGEETAWLYSKWCTGDTELYETYFDPFELENLAPKAAPGSLQGQMMNRLDALLMVTKSCSQDTCRDPWTVLRSSCVLDSSCPHDRIFSSIGTAMDPRFDEFFAKLPKVQMPECLEYQDVRNEGPYLPPVSSSLGSDHRKPTDNYKSPTQPGKPVLGNIVDQGAWHQRHTPIHEMDENARKLTKEELGIITS